MDSDKMLYVIDQIEDKVAICEQLNTKKKIEIPLLLLPSTISEGSIISCKDHKVVHERILELNRRKILRTKLEQLKKRDKGFDTDE